MTRRHAACSPIPRARPDRSTVDFHQFHIYDWVNQYWPYDQTAASYALGDKPVVMGEFPVGGLSGVSYGQLLESWFGADYAGGMGWAFTDPIGGDRNLGAIKTFADAHACESRF